MSAPTSAAAFAHTKNLPYWFETVKPLSLPALEVDDEFDLAIVGGGFSGLWSAIGAVRRFPHLRVAIFEAAEIANGGSGRNGGFLHASLTHGAANGINRWPNEYQKLRELGEANLQAIRNFVLENHIECDWRDAGEIEVSTAEYQTEHLNEFSKLAANYGEQLQQLSQSEVQERLKSPLFKAALFEADTVAMVNPAALAIGLAKFAMNQGVKIFEHSKVEKIKPSPAELILKINSKSVKAQKVILATNAYKSQFLEIRSRIVPVFDYQLATRPLTDIELEKIGWNGFEGFRDSSNQFHYFRRTADNRILFGGYDAVYHFGNKFTTAQLDNQKTYAKLAENFRNYFPQLKDITFDYAWGGAIDTCSRFTAFFGSKYQNRLAYVAGFTGLGVGASRFGAEVMLDKLYEPNSPILQLEIVRTKPLPFPPEPIRWLGIKLTQISLAKADENEGRRNLWLRLLDSLGLGFDS